ncbi:MAG TPA: hypothetical protein VFS40_14375 [Gemmatimonadales bacterium]|nr:hypothetical protein [Gemmatimonadales bacterium]
MTMEPMDMDMEPFDIDPRPDPVLGHLLREHLGAPDDAAFAARVRARLGELERPWRGRGRTSWDVLAGWAAPGLAAAAAAAVLVLAIGWWLLQGGAAAGPAAGSAAGPMAAGGMPRLEDALAGGVPAVLTASAPPPSADAVLGAIMEDR